ncbi:MAG: regulatory protein GemA [Desulfuromonadales bacterium]|nr:regulatory protein GemA [Desulfuromonadales bacterium]
MNGKTERTAVTKSQVKLIHAITGAMGLTEFHYRLRLRRSFGVFSSKELTRGEAATLINELKKEAFSLGVWHEPGRKAKVFDKLEGRPGFATAAQLGCIDAIWQRVARAPAGRKDTALRTFLQKVAGVSDLRFLTRAQASNVICILERMKKPRREKPQIPAEGCL